jgi:methionyl-tRNA formyltransferase
VRLIFMGTPEFALPTMETLLRGGYAIDTVVTGPDKPRGRGREPSPSPVKIAALSHGIPLLQPTSTRDPAFARALRARAPELIVVVAFRILPPEIITLPSRGAINLHASLLPRYRGAAPINWALINGEKQTGVTTFFLEEQVDTGEIILQREVPIGDDDDAGELHDRLAQVGAEVVLETVRSIEAGDPPRRPQDPAVASPAPKIFREHCMICWDQPASSIRNLIRGLAPHPGAFTTHHGAVVKIFRSAVEESVTSLPPGGVRRRGEQLLVGTGSAALSVLEIQQQGRRRMEVGEFLRGYRFAPNDWFSSGPADA